MEIVSRSPEETFDWGRRLAGLLRKGDVVALYGELGSGKTVFVQGVCAGLGVEAYVTSPSFVLVQEYGGRVGVVHVDFYRLTSPEEVEGLGMDEYFDGERVCLIEWVERGEKLLPGERFSVRLEWVVEGGEVAVGKRLIRLDGPGDRGLSSLMP